jgi:glycosyltransferase involved in cell wall biosynthesis
MKPVLVIHIDYGSAGSAGLYIEKILLATEGKTAVEAFLHHDFVGKRGGARVHRLFGMFSSKLAGTIFEGLGKVIELHFLFWLIPIIARIRSTRYRVVVVASFFQSFRAYAGLFRRLGRCAEVNVIVHDAVELSHQYPSIIMASRERILSYADCLLVHSQDSIEKLAYLDKRMVVIPFPPMKPDQPLPILKPSLSKLKFLFIGHIRPEKGLKTLLEAWRVLPDNVTDHVSLTVAGAISDGSSYDVFGLVNAELVLGFVDDELFCDLISKADFLVFPYTGGTNSGVYSIASALGKPSLTSRIPLFTQSPYFIEDLAFDTEKQLVRIITSLVFKRDQVMKFTKLAEVRASDVDNNFTKFFSVNCFSTL